MAKNTKIEWATHSWNPWIGCSKVHAGCKHCYAEKYGRRFGVTWGPNGTRRMTSDAYWRKPLSWQRKAADTGERPRIFSSLCDPFEDWSGLVGGTTKTISQLRSDFFWLIDHTPNLDWLLLTKRPENVRRMWPKWTLRGHDHATEPRYLKNVWLGVSVSNQQTADEMVHRLYHNCRDMTPCLFVSIEPLLGPVKLHHDFDGDKTRNWFGENGIDWLIVGGESGPKARPCNIEWIRDIVEQCKRAGVPCFVKQLGANAWGVNPESETVCPPPVRWRFAHPKGGDPAEWPEDLRVREVPENR